MTENYEVFVTYRNKSAESLAFLINDKLTNEYSYRVFLDFESLHSYKFDEEIYKIIDMCEDMVVILPPNSLDNLEENDYLSKEIDYAVSKKKNIVPVLMRGFKWPDNLSGALKEFSLYNGISASLDYFDASILKMVSLFDNPKSRKKIDNSIKKSRKFIEFLKAISFEEFLTSVSENIDKDDDVLIKGLKDIAEKRDLKDILDILDNLTNTNYQEEGKYYLENILNNYDDLNVGLYRSIINRKNKTSDKENRELYKTLSENLLFLYSRLRKDELYLEYKSRNVIMTSQEFLKFLNSITKSDYDKAKKEVLNDKNSNNYIPFIECINKGIEENTGQIKTMFESIKYSILVLRSIAISKKVYAFLSLLNELEVSFLSLINTDNYRELYSMEIAYSYLINVVVFEGSKNGTIEDLETQLICVVAAFVELTHKMDLYGDKYKEYLASNIDFNSLTVDKFRNILNKIDANIYSGAFHAVASRGNGIIFDTFKEYRLKGYGSFLYANAIHFLDEDKKEDVFDCSRLYENYIILGYMLNYVGVSGFFDFMSSITIDEYSNFTEEYIADYLRKNKKEYDELAISKLASTEDRFNDNSKVLEVDAYQSTIEVAELVMNLRKKN